MFFRKKIKETTSESSSISNVVKHNFKPIPTEINITISKNNSGKEFVEVIVEHMSDNMSEPEKYTYLANIFKDIHDDFSRKGARDCPTERNHLRII
ncbi:hypothetical protein [Pseudolactococcus insecticola]|uniref:Uncharacterized protein n=1 Tax=Pseudolactococcus insecticola TaxID=2709158 RepID=A0A6A0B735_9LACT|nr:hypothetical protein [Lactococcus insecticola]GFH41239.1 hypothetical protein Hs20B_16370 [Lactococcus insecticola]